MLPNTTASLNLSAFERDIGFDLMFEQTYAVIHRGGDTPARGQGLVGSPALFLYLLELTAFLISIWTAN